MASRKVPAAQLKRFEAVFALPENRECFDCTSKQPRWASTNLGILLCLRCAGVHRSLGVHITKVKSTTMDIWDEDMIQCVERIGNGNGRRLYLARAPPKLAKPDANCDTAICEKFARQQYERREFCSDDFEQQRAALLAAAPAAAVGRAAVSPAAQSPLGEPPVTFGSPASPPGVAAGQLTPQHQQQQQWASPVQATLVAPALMGFPSAAAPVLTPTAAPPPSSAAGRAAAVDWGAFFPSPAPSPSSPATAACPSGRPVGGSIVTADAFHHPVTAQWLPSAPATPASVVAGRPVASAGADIFGAFQQSPVAPAKGDALMSFDSAPVAPPSADGPPRGRVAVDDILSAFDSRGAGGAVVGIGSTAPKPRGAW